MTYTFTHEEISLGFGPLRNLTKFGRNWHNLDGGDEGGGEVEISLCVKVSVVCPFGTAAQRARLAPYVVMRWLEGQQLQRDQ